MAEVGAQQELHAKWSATSAPGTAAGRPSSTTITRLRVLVISTTTARWRLHQAQAHDRHGAAEPAHAANLSARAHTIMPSTEKGTPMALYHSARSTGRATNSASMTSWMPAAPHGRAGHRQAQP